MANLRLFLTLLILCGLAGCSLSHQTPSVHLFGTMPAGHPDEGKLVWLYTLENRHGMRVTIINYGATIVGIEVPDRYGHLADVTLGYDHLADYLGPNPYYGATIGRYAGRISHAKFTINETYWSLSANDGPHTLHGGKLGFDKRYWQTEIPKNNASAASGPSLKFSLLSPAGDQGFPGNLKATVTYTLTDANELIVHYAATTDAPTIVNLTQHTYFNLTGDPFEAGRHCLTLHADHYLEQSRDWFPTGRILPVADSDMDFRTPVRLGDRIYTPRTNPNFFDHTYVLSPSVDQGVPRLAAELHDPVSGRYMRIRTDQPTLHFYPGNSLLSHLPPGKLGRPNPRFSGICLEPQAWPDAPNHSAFPLVVLHPEETYEAVSIYEFGVSR